MAYKDLSEYDLTFDEIEHIYLYEISPFMHKLPIPFGLSFTYMAAIEVGSYDLPYSLEHHIFKDLARPWYFTRAKIKNFLFGRMKPNYPRWKCLVRMLNT